MFPFQSTGRPGAFSTVMSQSKVWFITGCSTGMGKTIARAALKRGDKVIATARNIAKLNDLKADGASVMELDVTVEFDAIKAKAKEAEAIYGRVDVVVNNAGFAAVSPVEELGGEGFVIQYKVNVFGVVNVTNAFLPYMRTRKEGTIIMMGSRSGWRKLKMLGAYSSSKAAVNILGEILALEVAPFNIRVLTVVAGGIATDGQSGKASLRSEATSHPDFVGIDDYAPMHDLLEEYSNTLEGKQLGDPVKVAEVILDVVRGEGVMKTADGGLREWPERLVLGSDAEYDIRNTVKSHEKGMEEWHDVLVSTDRRKFDP